MEMEKTEEIQKLKNKLLDYCNPRYDFSVSEEKTIDFFLEIIDILDSFQKQLNGLGQYIQEEK